MKTVIISYLIILSIFGVAPKANAEFQLTQREVEACRRMSKEILNSVEITQDLPNLKYLFNRLSNEDTKRVIKACIKDPVSHGLIVSALVMMEEKVKALSMGRSQ